MSLFLSRDTAPEDKMRREMKQIDKMVEETESELLSYIIDKVSEEMQKRSDKEEKYMLDRRRRLQ